MAGLELTRMICRRCGREVRIAGAACLTGTALWPRCCDVVAAFVTFPTPAAIEAVVGPLLVSVVAVLAARERGAAPHA